MGQNAMACKAPLLALPTGTSVTSIYGAKQSMISVMATHTSARLGNERAVFRRWQRYRLNLPIRLIVSHNGNTRITSGRATDISQGGLLVFAGIELTAGTEVFVEFTEPYSGEPIRARGLVRHRRGYNYGVEFHSETPAEQEQADKFRALVRMAAGSATP